MMEAARAGRFRCLYIEGLSRLARDSVITLRMLKELVDVCKVRIISVDDGIDSDDDSRELLASILSMRREQYL